MGTKNNPGPYDCYANAEPDEPMFVLLARDETAPYFVEAWAAVRCGDLVKAVHMMAQAIQARKTAKAEDKSPSDKKIIEARESANSMMRWQDERGII